MKNEKQIDISKTTVEQMREIRDKLNQEIKDLTSDQLKSYFKKHKTLHPNSVWEK